MVAFNFSAKIHLNFMRSCILNDTAKNKLEKSIELILNLKNYEIQKTDTNFLHEKWAKLHNFDENANTYAPNS